MDIRGCAFTRLVFDDGSSTSGGAAWDHFASCAYRLPRRQRHVVGLGGNISLVDPANFVGTLGSRKGLLCHYVPWQSARFLRLLIENRGRSTINDCKGYITGVTQIVNGNRAPLQQEVLELEWSSGGAAEARSVPRGAFFYMNVASLDPVQQGPPFVLRFCVLWLPNHFDHLFGHTATFELQIKIAADNAAPIDRVVRFDFDPQQQDLHFHYD